MAEAIKAFGFEDIQRANAEIKTTDLKGKEYAEVNQRIKAFRMLFPGGFIRTEIVSIEDGVCVMRAYVGFYDVATGAEHLLGTGTAYEKETASYINKTSYIENCETSCVGRALGMAGFGIDTSVASAEEVENAIAQQEVNKAAEKKVSKDILKGLEHEAGENGLTLDDLCKAYKVEKATDLTMEQLAQIRRNWGKLQEWKAKEIAKENERKEG